jgi:O-antigen/teichoic acid export membrane protein
MRIAIRGAQLLRTVILARLLAPDDFGLMAMATITILLVESLSRTGFRNALVQFDRDIDDHIDTAWTVEVLRGVVLGGLVFAGAPLIGSFFGNEEVVSIVRVVSLSVVINGWTNMALVQFDRDLAFNRVFRFEVTQRVVEVVVGIAAAIVLRSVWALVIGLIAGSIARVIASFVLIPRRIRFEIDRAKVSEMYHYGKWIYGTNLSELLSGELDDILVGRILGADLLGLYRMAYTLSQSLVTEIGQTTNQVVFSAFARLQSTGRAVKEALVRSAHFVAFLVFPMAVLFIVAGEQITLVLLGEQWLDMVPSFRVLTVAGTLEAVTAVVKIMFESAGVPQLATRYSVVRLSVLAVLIFPAIQAWGLLGASFSVLASSVVSNILVVRASRRFGAGFRVLASAFAWPFFISLLMGAVVLLVLSALGGGNSLLGLTIAVASGVITYLGSAWLASRYLSYAEPRELLLRLKGMEA